MSQLLLSNDFYLNQDVVTVSRALLGKVLCSEIDGIYTAGIISETEAYEGETDRACHAFSGKKTARTQTMYLKGGHAYVYLCYGIHHLFNVVTGPEGLPHVVLIRGIQPLEGINEMLLRRNKQKQDAKLSAGPGTLSQALGIKTTHNQNNLQGDMIWIEDRGFRVSDDQIKIGPRIGVDYAGNDALLPYRFLVKGAIEKKLPS